MIDPNRKLRATVPATARLILLAGLILLRGLFAGGDQAQAGLLRGDRAAKVPPFLAGTIYEFANLENIDPYPVSGYGLTVGLANTGGNVGVPATVRDYMLDEMFKHRIGLNSGDPTERRFEAGATAG